MAPPWHLQDKVNNSPDVAAPPRRTWQPGTLQAIVMASLAICSRWNRPGRRRPPQHHPKSARDLGDSPDLEDLPMPDAVKVGFVPFSDAARGVLVVFCDDTLKF